MKRAHNLVDVSGLLAVPKLVGVAKRLGTHGIPKEGEGADRDLKSLENSERLRAELLRPLDRTQIDEIRRYTADKGTALLARIVKKLGKSFGVFPPQFAMTLEVSDRETAMTMKRGFYDADRPYDNATFLQFQLQTRGELAVDRAAMADLMKSISKVSGKEFGPAEDKEVGGIIADLNERINAIRSAKWPGVFASYPVRGKHVPIIFVPDMEHQQESAKQEATGDYRSAGARPVEEPPYLYATFRSLETAHTVVNVLEPLVPVSGIRNLARKALAGTGKSDKKEGMQ